MPNMSSGIIYICGKDPQAIENFASHGMNHHTMDGFPLVDNSYPRTELDFWHGDYSRSMEYLGDGRYVLRMEIECAWSCVGCVLLAEAMNGTTDGQPDEGVIFMDQAAVLYNVGFIIEAEENGFSEFITCNNKGEVSWEQPDITFLSHVDDENHTFEIRRERSGNWFIMEQEEVVEDAMRQGPLYFDNEDEAIHYAGEQLGAEV